MSENGEHRDSARADTGPKWVWTSTKESVERGAISVLACAEVAAGIWLYWWLIPWWFETNLHLLISILVAPLLLLRSPASVEAALAAFDRYVHRDEDVPLGSTRGAVVMLLTAGLSVLASWGLVETWLSGHDGWSLFWRAGIIGWICIQIGGAVTVAGAVAVTGAVAVAGTAAVAGAVAGARAVAVAGVIAGVIAVTVARAATSHAEAAAFAGGRGVVGRLVAKAVATPGGLLGTWLRSMIIKIGSTVRHLAVGWGRLSVNWRSSVWAHDLRRPPELLPGIERHPKLSWLGIRNMLSHYKRVSGPDRVVRTFIVALSLPIFFLPAWLYRLSLKSTCWFWWPLVFFQTSGRAAARAVAEGGNLGAVVAFKEHSKTWLAKFRLGLALALLVVAFGVPQDLLSLLPVSKGGIDLIGWLGNMIYLMLPCAGVQLALFLHCNEFLPRAEANLLGSGPRTTFRWLVSIRNFLLSSGLIAAFALLLGNWFPILTPFAEFAAFVETHYFSWFPFLTWT